jgi:hypothetical protein
LVAGDGWSNADKGRIVAESFAAGVVVSEAARRHEILRKRLLTACLVFPLIMGKALCLL